MKIIRKSFADVSLISLILTVALVSNCTFLTSSNSNELEGNKLLFEVINNPDGPIYPPEKTVVLRVFNNANVEFDYYLPSGPKRVGIPFSSEIKSAKITQEELNKFKSLLEKLDDKDYKNHYQPTQIILDAKITITINYQSKEGMKQIVIDENDSHLHLEKTLTYPPALIDLMKLVEEVNIDKLKEAYNQNGIPYS